MYTPYIYAFLEKRNKRVASIKVTPEQKQRAEKRLAEIGDRKPKWYERELGQETRNLKAIVSFENHLSTPDFEIPDYAEQLKIK